MIGSLGTSLAAAWRNPSGKSGLAILLALIGLAIAGPWFLPDPTAITDIGNPLAAPSPAHWLGTDHLSRDLLARVATGARISLSVAAIAAVLSLTIGTAVGIAAGLFGGVVDAALMRIVDAALAIPRLFVLLLLLVVWDRVPLAALVVVIGATGWFATSRMVRGEVLRLRREEYLQAAAALGAGPLRTIFRHLLPNVAGVILVSATLSIGDVILLEAGLSYLGVGVQPPTPSWGVMVFDARNAMTTAPWTLFFPGLAVVLTVLATSLVSDALRAAFDPRGA